MKKKQIEEVLGYKIPRKYAIQEGDSIDLIFGEYGENSSTWDELMEMEEELQLVDGYEFTTGRGDDVPNAVTISKGADLSKLIKWKDVLNCVFYPEY